MIINGIKLRICTAARVALWTGVIISGAICTERYKLATEAEAV